MSPLTLVAFANVSGLQFSHDFPSITLVTRKNLESQGTLDFTEAYSSAQRNHILQVHLTSVARDSMTTTVSARQDSPFCPTFSMTR